MNTSSVSSSNQLSFTPSPKRRRQIAATPWKPPTEGSPERLAWDVSKVPKVLSDALNPKSTIETRLRCSNTLRRATESAPLEARNNLRKKDPAALVASICAIANSADSSASGARVKIHCIVSLINLLGDDIEFDEFVAYHQDVSLTLVECLRDAHTITVSAAAQLLRKISEIESVAHLVILNDEWFSATLHLLETVIEDSVNPHLLSALINVAGSSKGQFPMARCARLLQILVELSFDCTNNPQRAVQASKCCANLLAFPDNCAEMKRLAPSLVNAMLEGSEVAAAACEAYQATQHQQNNLGQHSAASFTSSLGGAGGMNQDDLLNLVFEELRDVSRIVLEELHTKDILALHAQLNAELAQGRAVATRMRSHVLSPQSEMEDTFRKQMESGDWVGAIMGSTNHSASAAAANIAASGLLTSQQYSQHVAATPSMGMGGGAGGYGEQGYVPSPIGRPL